MHEIEIFQQHTLTMTDPPMMVKILMVSTGTDKVRARSIWNSVPLKVSTLPSTVKSTTPENRKIVNMRALKPPVQNV